ncbi:MAG TPA: substrate-binding domain-containing protein [Pseudonocardia sp.]|uniref:substrate-binding domain-containing protein n=1 Tax=Pseudonocardia sp. TaxID=60912 RepID=UPI002B4B15D8|nr:substrate-binding domain-containing protein [Pseudonocardia sp.]HLU58500.1 substrate-binding domain-containing protein [Pseudonocardia sp.]
MSTRKTMRSLAVAAALGLALAACSSQGGARQEQGGGDAPAGNVGGEQYTIAMITHEQPGDTFWDRIRAGAEDAARALNVDLRYSNGAQAPEQATLVQNAIDSQVDGIAVTLAQLEQVGPAAKAAADRGIPVVAFNAGLEDYERFGAKMYFGSDEIVAGRAAGERLAQDGAQKVICVVQEQGHVALEARCAGVRESFPNTENLYVQGTDLPSVRSTIGARLREDPSITHVIALGAPFALTALEAVSDAGSQAKVATFDLNVDAAQAIQEGRIMFAVDQQPYVQGYMAVTSLWLNLSNGNDIGGGGPVLTGPSFVDSTNIDQILTYAQNNKR